MQIDQAILDQNLLGAGLGDPASWRGWLSILKAAFGLRLTEGEQAFFASVAGARVAPQAPVSELWCVVGRRSGKSRVAAALAVFVACFQEHKLAPGETGHVLCLSASRAQARTIFRYCLGYLESAPMLAREVDSVTADEIRLRNGIEIAAYSNSYRTVRGRTILAAIFDEIAFWRDDASANPDREIYRAVLPSLAASGGPLVAISTPYRKAGLLYERHKAYFGQDDPDVLVIQGPSTLFNPTLKQVMIDRALRDDPEAAGAEWHAEFRFDIDNFLDDTQIMAAVDTARPRELPPRPGISYAVFVDASGGRSDAYTCVIGHRQGDRFITDVVAGQAPPFNPSTITARLASMVQAYGVKKVVGDSFGAEWVSTAWRSQGLTYERADLPASSLYLECLPAFMREQISIPDHPQLIRELRQLERRTSRLGRDTVTHPPGGHDDYANALAGCLRVAQAKPNKAFLQVVRGGF
jgi:Terminase large subunit, T4likevirus-type, N-terminal